MLRVSSSRIRVSSPSIGSAGARSVVEVGAYAGDLTALLMDWAASSGARVTAVDPSPQDSLVELAEANEGLELIRETSLDALKHIELPDAVVIDGDQDRRWQHPSFHLDVAPGAAGGFSLEALEDLHFTAESGDLLPSPT